MIMFEKFGQHQPLNRQAERYALEGVPIALSTMADAVGSVVAGVVVLALMGMVFLLLVLHVQPALRVLARVADRHS